MERFTVHGELVELEVCTMAKNPNRVSNPGRTQPESEPFARECSSSFYRRLGPLPPKHLGRKGYHMATKGEERCTIKVVSTIKVENVDAVHGRGAASPKLKRGTVQPGRWLALRTWDGSHGDVALGA